MNKEKEEKKINTINCLNCLTNLDKYIKKLQQENIQLKDKLIEINEVINGYMPNVHAMCKAFDEIEFILSKEVE